MVEAGDEAFGFGKEGCIFSKRYASRFALFCRKSVEVNATRERNQPRLFSAVAESLMKKNVLHVKCASDDVILSEKGQGEPLGRRN